MRAKKVKEILHENIKWDKFLGTDFHKLRGSDEGPVQTMHPDDWKMVEDLAENDQLNVIKQIDNNLDTYNRVIGSDYQLAIMGGEDSTPEYPLMITFVEEKNAKHVIRKVLKPIGIAGHYNHGDIVLYEITLRDYK